MRRLKLSALLIATATMLATTAFAQRYPNQRDPYGRGPNDRDPYYRDGYGNRDAYGNRDRSGNRGGYRNGDPVNRAIQNLQRAASMNRYDKHERNHFDKALKELRKFQDRSRSGRFDGGALDKAISNMSDLARARQLHPRDRDLIVRDISELRQVRASGGGYYDPYARGRDPYSRW
jgi:hypothetical protein